MNSDTMTPKRSWKQLLAEAKRLQGRLGTVVYRRTKLLNQVFSDAEFRASIGARDDDAVGQWLDVEFTGVALTFLQLRYLLERYPNECDWEKGDFLRMFERCREEDAAKQPAREPIIRKRVTRAEFEEVKQEAKEQEYRAKQAERHIQAAVERAEVAVANAAKLSAAIEKHESVETQLRNRLAALEEERREHVQEIARLRARVAELESLLESSGANALVA